MFAKDKVTKSMIDAVNKVMEDTVEEGIKIATSTGTKVLGSSYGNSAKAHQDQTKKDIDKIKGPSTKELTGKGDKESKNEEWFKDKLINNFIEEEIQLESEINEVLSKDASAGEWISDFIHSDNPKFAGKSKKMRQKMALAAYYAKKNEEVEIDEAKMKEELKGNQKKIDKNHNNKIDAQDFAILRGQKNEEVELEENAYKMADGPVTTDTLAGRVDGGKSDSFKSFKLRVKPLDKEGEGEDRVPDCEEPEDTPARQSVKARGGQIGVREEEVVEESMADEHGIGRDIADKKEKMDRLKTPAKPGPLHNVGKGFKAFLQGKKEPMESVEVEGEQIDEKAGYSAKAARAGKDIGKPGKAFAKIAKSAGERYGSEEKGKKVAGAILAKLRKEEIQTEGKHSETDNVPFVTNSEQPPFDKPYTSSKGTVTDKSGAKHTPMSRARDLARAAMKKVKNEMLGQAPGNNG